MGGGREGIELEGVHVSRVKTWARIVDVVIFA